MARSNSRKQPVNFVTLFPVVDTLIQVFSLVSLVLVLVVVFTVTETNAGYWGYLDQSDWSKLVDSSCGGLKQSPIDLPDVCDSANSVTRVNSAINLTLINYGTLPSGALTLSNNGHTAIIKLRHSSQPNVWIPQLTGTVVNGQVYQLLQLHFHWDKRSTHIGSEHALHGTRRAFEMHLVHFNTKYKSPKEASTASDGFAVLGTFFDDTEDEETNNPEMDKIVLQLRQISEFNSTVDMKRSINLRNLLPSDIDTFYTYEGSLTTPPCLEIIRWIIFPQAQKIGPNQLFAFERSLDAEDERVLSRTCRDLQPLNSRIVYASSDKQCNGKSPPRASTSLIQTNRPTVPSVQVPNSVDNNNNNNNKPVKVVSSNQHPQQQHHYSRRPNRQGLVPGLVGGLLG